MTRIVFVELLFLIFAASGALADEAVQYEFTTDGSDYSFQGWFYVEHVCDGLLEILFDYKNVERYSGGVSEIERGAHGDDWYELTYTYRRLAVLKSTSTWRRTLNRDTHKIEFDMITSTNNVAILPTVRSSRGYLEVAPEDGAGCRIEYSQKTTLAPGFAATSLPIRLARRETVAFMHALQSFVLSQSDLTR